MTLQDALDRRRTEGRARLAPAQRQALEDAVERLRMLQVVEQGLAVGDVLPDFALPDAAGRIVTSEALLARGPLAVVFLRGPWCPFCSLTMEALESIRPEVEALGAELVGILPLASDAIARLGPERGLGLLLLSDLDLAYAAICGVRFEMTTEVKQLYLALAVERGQDIPNLDADQPWPLPVPATYVVDRQGVIRFAFGDADWTRRAEPRDLLAAVERLAQEAAAT